MDQPFKDLTDNEEYEGNGQRHPQVAGLGVHSSIPILQVSPAQALRKPPPLLPEPLTELRQHPEAHGHKRSQHFQTACNPSYNTIAII